MDYLKNEQHYVDLYDLHTIEECLRYYWSIKDGLEKHRKDKAFKKFTKEEFDKEVQKCYSYTINAIKTEKYRHKKSTIEEWIDWDRTMQELYDNTEPPEGIMCKECRSPTKVTLKTLHDSYSDKARMTFMFVCIKCGKRQARYEDGTEWKYDPPLCPKCNAIVEIDVKEKGNKTIYLYKCTKCDYRKEDIEDWEKSKKEREAKEIRNKELLNKFRSEFCLDDKEGPEYVSSFDRLIAISKELKEREKKQEDPAYQKAKKLKKLTVVELEQLLLKMINKKDYIKLNLGTPEVGRYIIIPFSVQEVSRKTNERESDLILKKVIDGALKDTNWRLMSEGISYRLGILTGRLKAYENEDDLINIVKND